MHVLYFHQYFNTPQGSGGIRSYQMARRLIERGHSVTMVCGSTDRGGTGLNIPFRKGMRRGVVDGIQVIEFDLAYSNYDGFLKRTWSFLRYALRSIGLALTLPYDLAFATSTPLTAGIPGIIARFLRHKPFVFEVRDLWPELPREMGVITNPVVLRLMDWLEWTTYHAASACIGLSPGIVQGIQRRGIPAERVTMIPNGSDIDLVDDLADEIRPPNVSPADLCAIFAGAHGLANGLDAVLDAGRELKLRHRDDIKLILIGDGSQKPRLQQRAQAEGIDNCLFLHPLPKRELIRLLRGSDVGLMILANVPAFYYGTSPNKFFDYIAVGLPVLNNYPGWLADLITENDCGLAVPPNNPVAFANALEYLTDHPTERTCMGLNARRLAETRFSRDLLFDEFERVLLLAAEEGRHP